MYAGLRFTVIIVCTVLFHSCVFKKLEESETRLDHQIKENKDMESRFGAMQEKCTNDLKKYKDSIIGLNQRITELADISPKGLLESNDSLKQELKDAKGLSSKYLKEKTAIADSLQRLRTETNNFFHLKGSYSQRITAPEGTYDCFIVDTRYTDLKLYWKDSTNTPIRSLDKLKTYTSEQCELLLFATNGGMYKPDNSPQGLFIEEGQELIPIDLRKEEYGNFYMQPNGIFLIDTNNVASIIVSDDFDDTIANRTRFATQSGPMAVTHGKINSKFTPGSKSKHIRSGVGIINKDMIVFLISNQPVCFYDFAKVFVDKFQCKEALYLDGAISKMYLPGLGRFEKGGNFGPIIGITK